MKTRKGRAAPRPLATKSSMHLVLRSTKARGAWSMKHPRNEQKIRQLTQKFCQRYGVRLHSLANVGNHLHFHIQLANRHSYAPFIRGLTGAIAMAVSGRSRWATASQSSSNPAVEELGRRPLRFWDCRPFTRVIISRQAWLNLRDYIQVNVLEGFGHSRQEARWILQNRSRTRFESG